MVRELVSRQSREIDGYPGSSGNILRRVIDFFALDVFPASFLSPVAGWPEFVPHSGVSGRVGAQQEIAVATIQQSEGAKMARELVAGPGGAAVKPDGSMYLGEGSRYREKISGPGTTYTQVIQGKRTVSRQG